MPRFFHYLLAYMTCPAGSGLSVCRVMGFVAYGLLLSLAALPAIGQNHNATAPGINLEGESFFSRQLDLFNWRYALRSSYRSADDAYLVEFSNLFNSRFYLLGGEVQNIQDENTALLSARMMPRRNDRYGIALESRSLRITNTNLKQDHALLGLYYRHSGALAFDLKSLAGILQEERSQQQDTGLMLGLRAQTQAYNIGEIQLSNTAYADYADISPRVLQTYRFNTQGLLNTDELNVRANVELARNIRESYQADSFFNRDRSDFIESVKSDTTAIYSAWEFPLTESVSGQVELGGLRNVRRTTNRRISSLEERAAPLVDTRILRQEIDLRFQAEYAQERTALSGGVLYAFATREGQVENPGVLADTDLLQQNERLLNSNFEQQRIELFGSGRLNLGADNISRLDGRISIFNYDTPEINRDDRDELAFSLSLENRHQFSEGFRTRVRLSGEGRHTVYLFSERSIQNNWRRSLRLAPAIDWQITPWLYSSYNFLVRANYTVYDFETTGQQNNDQVSREFKAGTNLEARLSPEWTLHLAASRAELRVGRLLWDEFREVPTDTLVTYDTRAGISFQKGELHTTVGLRYFLKLDFLPAATVTAEQPALNEDEPPATLSRTAPGRQRSLQWGPTVEMRLPLHARNELFISGWYQIQRQRQRLYTVYPEEVEEAFRRAENEARTTIFPNIEMRALFRF